MTTLVETPILSAREQALLEGIAEGLLDKELMDRVHLCKGTIHWHIRRMCERFGIPGGASSRVRLTVYAFRNGLLK